jgi:hypothetical protein
LPGFWNERVTLGPVMATPPRFHCKSVMVKVSGAVDVDVNVIACPVL